MGWYLSPHRLLPQQSLLHLSSVFFKEKRLIFEDIYITADLDNVFFIVFLY